MKRDALLLTVLLLIFAGVCLAEETPSRWTLQEDGSIVWNDFSEGMIPHEDHIEASGEQVSVVLYYGVDEKGAFKLRRSIVWPMLRTIPNNTHASLTRSFDVDVPSLATANGMRLSNEKVKSIRLNGFLTVESAYEMKDVSLETTRRIFPSTTGPFVCERVSIKNVSD
ncbi:MAG: hypothetical protein II622_01630, partial [Thermoguttaceae bacterium]|nr:hypothetical protein [Thermoguttaceae bacterium]